MSAAELHTGRGYEGLRGGRPRYARDSMHKMANVPPHACVIHRHGEIRFNAPARMDNEMKENTWWQSGKLKHGSGSGQLANVEYSPCRFEHLLGRNLPMRITSFPGKCLAESIVVFRHPCGRRRKQQGGFKVHASDPFQRSAASACTWPTTAKPALVTSTEVCSNVGSSHQCRRGAWVSRLGGLIPVAESA